MSRLSGVYDCTVLCFYALSAEAATGRDTARVLLFDLLTQQTTPCPCRTIDIRMPHFGAGWDTSLGGNMYGSDKRGPLSKELMEQLKEDCAK